VPRVNVRGRSSHTSEMTSSARKRFLRIASLISPCLGPTGAFLTSVSGFQACRKLIFAERGCSALERNPPTRKPP
jgi:hypothetical protein